VAIVSQTNYVDAKGPRRSLYMVRAAIRTTTGCGAYTNLTQGVFAP
jgi:hypothetical protein